MTDGYSHQDWEPVVLKKHIQKKQQNNLPGSKLMKNLSEDGEIPQLKKMSKEQSNAIIAARNAKQLTQKDLANKLNFDISIIKDYESGNVNNFNKTIYNRIMRVLGTKV